MRIVNLRILSFANCLFRINGLFVKCIFLRIGNFVKCENLINGIRWKGSLRIRIWEKSGSHIKVFEALRHDTMTAIIQTKQFNESLEYFYMTTKYCNILASRVIQSYFLHFRASYKSKYFIKNLIFSFILFFPF